MPEASWSNDEYTGSGFEPIPKSVYLCFINGSIEKKTKAGDGKYWEFDFAVAKGEFKGRKLWARLNVVNPSDIAQRIGREQYTALCIAAGQPGSRQTEKLHGKLVLCIVDIKESNQPDPAHPGKMKPMNEITGWMKPSDAQAQGAEKTPQREARQEAQERNEARKPQPVATGGGDNLDDDIPF